MPKGRLVSVSFQTEDNTSKFRFFVDFSKERLGCEDFGPFCIRFGGFERVAFIRPDQSEHRTYLGPFFLHFQNTLLKIIQRKTKIHHN